MAIAYDSVTGNAIPLNAVVVIGYLDGPYGPADPFHTGWTLAAWTKYPHAAKVTITVTGTPGARVIDCERGDVTVAQAVTWAQNEIKAGRRPTIYAAAWTWSAQLDPALAHVGLKRVRDLDGWQAHTGIAPIVPTGFVALQYLQDQPGVNGGRVDISITDGVWPGPIPTPPTVVPEDLFTMLSSDPEFAVRFLYRVCLHREADPSGFGTYVNYLNGGGTLNQVMTDLQDSTEGQTVIAAERKSLGLA